MYGYEWTKENGIFRLSIDVKVQKEIRPVFHEELDFFGMDTFWDYPESVKFTLPKQPKRQQNRHFQAVKSEHVLHPTGAKKQQQETANYGII